MRWRKFNQEIGILSSGMHVLGAARTQAAHSYLLVNIRLCGAVAEPLVSVRLCVKSGLIVAAKLRALPLLSYPDVRRADIAPVSVAADIVVNATCADLPGPSACHLM